MSLSSIHLLHIGQDLPPLERLIEAPASARSLSQYQVTRLSTVDRLGDRGFDAALVAFPDPDAVCASVASLAAAQPDLPIIAIAGKGSDGLAHEALQRGARDFLALDDPLTAPLLDRAIRAVIDQARLTRVLGEADAHYSLENAADLIARLTPAGLITYVSPACRSLLGYLPDELIGASVRDLFHPDELPAVVEMSALALRARERSALTVRIRHKDGRYIWFETTLYGTRDLQSGDLVEIVTSSRDVSERRTAQELLRASEERFASVFRNSPVAFMVMRLSDQRMVDVNASFEALFGYRHDEAVGHTGVELGLWRDLRRRQRAIDDIRAGRVVRDYEAQFVSRSGALFEGMVSMERVELAGEPCVFQVINDITERKRAETEITDAARFMRSTLDALIENIAILDKQGTIVAVNRAWLHCEPHMCWTAGIGEGTPYLDFCELATGPEGRTGRAIAAGIRAVMSGARDHFYYEYSCTREEGDETWYSVDVTPYPNDDRYSVVVAHLDITARIRAESAQRVSDARFRYAINNLPDVIVIFDAWRRVRFANQTLLNLWGLTEEQVIGLSAEDLLDQQWLSQFLPPLDDAFQTGTPRQFVTELHGKRGTAYFYVFYVPQFDRDGRIYEMLAIAHDVTEHKRAEQAEQEQRTLAEALRDTSAILTSTLDLRTVMVRILENVGRVVSHDAASIMLIEGESARVAYWQGYDDEHSQYFVRERFPLDWPKFREMMATGQPMLVPDVAQDPEWHPLPLKENPRSTVAVPIRSHDGMIGFLNLDSSVAGYFNESHADRLRAFADYAAIAVENAQLYETMRYYAAELEQRVDARTQDLLHAKEHLEAILDSRSDAVVLTFLTGVIRQINPAFAELFGYDAAEIVGKSIEMLTAGDHSEVLDALNEVVLANQPRRLECVMHRKDGSLFDADTILSPLQNGTLFGIVCSVRDISARKQMEQELRRAYERERELGELKSRFVSMASHEFRSPLSTILASSDMLRHYGHKMTEERRGEHFDNIENTIRHLTRLIDDVLLLGRADAHRVDLKLVSTDLVRSINDIVLETAPLSGLNGAPVYFECPVPVLEAPVDRNLLRQIVTNLLSNAIKYSPQATPVYCRITRQDTDIILTVQDSGIGIPAKDREHLFDAFHRGGNVANVEGTGLGLAIVLRAVKLHGGTISFESEVNRGTTFTVRIPLAPVLPDQSMEAAVAADGKA